MTRRPATDRPGRRLRRLARATQLLLVAGLAAYFVSAGTLDGLATRLAGLAPSWLGLALAAHLAGYFLGACALALLLRRQGMGLSAWRVFEVSLATQFYGLVLPGGAAAAGAFRWYRLGFATRKMPEVLTALATSRVLELLSISGLALAGWSIDPIGSAGATVGLGLGGLLGGLGVAYSALSSRRLALRLVRLLRRLARPGRAPRRLAFRVLAAVRNHGKLTAWRHAGLVSLSLARNAVGAAAVYALARGLGLEVPLGAIVWLRSLVAVLVMLPFAMAGLGVRETTFVVLLQPYGVAPGDGLSLSLAVFGLAVLTAAAGGLLEILRSASGVRSRPRRPNDRRPPSRGAE